jgi:hypothetical protein
MVEIAGIALISTIKKEGALKRHLLFLLYRSKTNLKKNKFIDLQQPVHG